jgi:hypothetical protein
VKFFIDFALRFSQNRRLKKNYTLSAPMIKKFGLVLVAGSLTFFNLSAYAGSGIFGSGVELNANGALTNTLYALNDSGGTRLKPVGSTATLDETSWANGSEAVPVLNLGTFNPGAGNSLTLTGGALLTFKNGGSDVTGAFLDFRVFPAGSPSGLFTEFSLPFNEDNVAGNTGDQRWASETQSFNLLSGLPNGSYELGVFLRETSTDGGAFSSNGGANYGATFQVVPEPSTWVAGAMALVGCFYLRYRRRKA